LGYTVFLKLHEFYLRNPTRSQKMTL